MKKILRLALIAVLCAFGVACAMAVDLSSKQKTFINNTQTVNNDLKGDKNGKPDQKFSTKLRADY